MFYMFVHYTNFVVQILQILLGVGIHFHGEVVKVDVMVRFGCVGIDVNHAKVVLLEIHFLKDDPNNGIHIGLKLIDHLIVLSLFEVRFEIAFSHLGVFENVRIHSSNHVEYAFVLIRIGQIVLGKPCGFGILQEFHNLIGLHLNETGIIRNVLHQLIIGLLDVVHVRVPLDRFANIVDVIGSLNRTTRTTIHQIVFHLIHLGSQHVNGIHILVFFIIIIFFDILRDFQKEEIKLQKAMLRKSSRLKDIQ